MIKSVMIKLQNTKVMIIIINNDVITPILHPTESGISRCSSRPSTSQWRRLRSPTDNHPWALRNSLEESKLSQTPRFPWVTPRS